MGDCIFSAVESKSHEVLLTVRLLIPWCICGDEMGRKVLKKRKSERGCRENNKLESIFACKNFRAKVIALQLRLLFALVIGLSTNLSLMNYCLCLNVVLPNKRKLNGMCS